MRIFGYLLGMKMKSNSEKQYENETVLFCDIFSSFFLLICFRKVLLAFVL